MTCAIALESHGKWSILNLSTVELVLRKAKSVSHQVTIRSVALKSQSILVRMTLLNSQSWMIQLRLTHDRSHKISRWMRFSRSRFSIGDFGNEGVMLSVIHFFLSWIPYIVSWSRVYLIKRFISSFHSIACFECALRVKMLNGWIKWFVSHCHVGISWSDVCVCVYSTKSLTSITLYTNRLVYEMLINLFVLCLICDSLLYRRLTVLPLCVRCTVHNQLQSLECNDWLCGDWRISIN